MNNHIELCVMIPRELMERLIHACGKKGMKKPAVVRRALEMYLRERVTVRVDSERPL